MGEHDHEYPQGGFLTVWNRILGAEPIVKAGAKLRNLQKSRRE
jgi:hypothetical protein